MTYHFPKIRGYISFTMIVILIIINLNVITIHVSSSKAPHQSKNGNFNLEKIIEFDYDVRGAVFSNDGSSLAVALSDKNISIYETSTWTITNVFRAEYEWGVHLYFSPNNSIIAVNDYNSIKFYDVKTGGFIKKIDGYSDYIYDVSFSPNGNYLVLVSEKDKVHMWNVKNWSYYNITIPEGDLQHWAIGNIVEWAVNSTWLYISTSHWTCWTYVWDMQFRNIVKTWGGIGSPIGISNQGDKLFSQSAIYDANTGVLIRNIWPNDDGDYDYYSCDKWTTFDDAIMIRFSKEIEGRNTDESRHYDCATSDDYGVLDIATGDILQFIDKDLSYTSWIYCPNRNMCATIDHSFIKIYLNDGDQDSCPDYSDDFPFDPAASIDTDGDCSPDEWNPGKSQKNSTTGLYIDSWPTDLAASLDSDGDWYPDRWTPGMGPENSTSGLTRLDDLPFEPAASKDADGDGWPDEWNEGCDEDDSITGLHLDVFPSDPTQWNDTDEDGFGDNLAGNNSDIFPLDRAASKDTDGDGYPDCWNAGKTQIDSTTGLKIDDFPLNHSQWNDTDGDGWGDNYGNPSWWRNRTIGLFIYGAYKPDAFPLDPTQWNDTDGDGFGDNQSGSNPDLFPDDKWDWNDTDSDGVGDNYDTDIDGDGWGNPDEKKYGTDPWDYQSYPKDFDGDQIPDTFDDDIDNDGYNNTDEIKFGSDPYDNSNVPINNNTNVTEINDTETHEPQNESLKEIINPILPENDDDDGDDGKDNTLNDDSFSFFWLWLVFGIIILLLTGTIILFTFFRCRKGKST